jgi:hypothetical protein
MTLAPIALFTYNRPDQTFKTIKALADNVLADKSVMYVFCDGPKNNADEKELERINRVRNIVKNIDGFKEIIIVEQPENIGLANSIINGVTEVINKHGSIIVLEDDIFTSKYFLQFMNDALNVYQNSDKVISVGACNYFAEGKKYPSTFFLPVVDCLGWATWKDRWQHFEIDSVKLLKEIKDKQLENEFNLFDFYKFENMLQDQIDGKINSWAIRWQAVCILQKKLTIYPNPSITQHMHSVSGTHASGLNIEPKLANKQIDVDILAPEFYFSSYKALLKGYNYFLIQSKYVLFKQRIKFYMHLFLKKQSIITYIKNDKN